MEFRNIAKNGSNGNKHEESDNKTGCKQVNHLYDGHLIFLTLQVHP